VRGYNARHHALGPHERNISELLDAVNGDSTVPPLNRRDVEPPHNPSSVNLDGSADCNDTSQRSQVVEYVQMMPGLAL
jgi:hypothetical protein